MKRPKSLTAKLQKCDTEIKLYVTELEKENLNLQKQIAKLQVESVSQQNKITAFNKAQPKIVIKPTNFSDKKHGKN